MKLLLAQFDRPQLLLLAGMVLLGWVLIRRTIAAKQRMIREGRQADQSLRAMRQPKTPAVPLCDAPPETQRWQIAMFDLQRELKGELDSRIAITQALIRQADERIQQVDERIAELSQLDSAEGAEPPCPDPRPCKAGGKGTDSPVSQSNFPGDARDRIAELAASGLTASEVSEQTGLPIGEVELILGTLEPPE